MQSKPIRNSDFDANTAKHVTFYNENFKRGRYDLLRKIQRSTRGGGSNPGQNQERDINQLKDKVINLEKTIQDLHAQQEERMRRLELDMLGRMEQMMLAMQQQQQQQQQPQYQHLRSIGNNSMGGASMMPADLHKSGGVGVGPNGHGNMNGMNGMNNNGGGGGGGLTNAIGESLDPLPYGARGASVSTISGLAHLMGNQHASIGMKNGFSGIGAPSGIGGPTLPPHPKQKQLQTHNLPGSLSHPPGRVENLRGISALSFGVSNLSRGISSESQGGGNGMGNAFEDKFFSMLMNGEKNAAGSHTNNNSMYPTPMSAPAPQNNMNNNGMKGPVPSRGGSDPI